MSGVRAVFFDVDFTLIYPGPTFQGEGYRDFCANYGIDVDPQRFPGAVLSAAHILDRERDGVYDPQIFIEYVAHIIEAMGGRGARIESCAVEIYEAWAACRHFVLYDDVQSALKALSQRNILLGLISNTHRSLDTFRAHFELDSLINVAVSSSEHGYMKPHPRIFEAALALAGVSARDAVMVGDSPVQDIEGARRVGMRGVLVRRSENGSSASMSGVPVIKSLSELPDVL